MTKEIEFPFEDIIISRTDGRGVIQAANEAFVDISRFDRAELHGAPHKILRHPDMPKGVFHAIWSALLQGQPIGGYVKNKTKDGNSYWVFATISPIEGGYISMRIRPNPESVENARELYQRMLKREQEDGFTPEQSADYMVEALQKNGFADYLNFLGRQLTAEVLTRNKATNRPSNQTLETLHALLPIWKGVGDDCSKVFNAYSTFGEVPSNLRLQARNLNEIGASLGAVAVNFTTIAAKITEDLEKYSISLEEVNQSVSRALFLTAAACLLGEAANLMALEGATEQDQSILTGQANAYRAAAEKETRSVNQNLDKFWRGSKRIKRDFTGLSMTRVMCAIETAKVPHNKAEHIRSIIAELDRFQKIGDDGLEKICDDVEKIRRRMHELVQTFKISVHAMDLAS